MKTKTCTKCGKELSIDNFGKHTREKDGLRAWCKVCTKERLEEYKKMPKKIKVIAKEGMKICTRCGLELSIDNFGNTKNSKDGLRYECKECHNGANRKSYVDNPELVKVYQKKYREEHHDRKLKTCRNYVNANKDKEKIRHAKYSLENKEQVNTKTQRHRAKKKLLPYTFTKKEWDEVKITFNQKCCYCGKKSPLQMEHFIPVNKNGGFIKGNIICACGSCNQSKSDINFEDWYPKHKSYSKDREIKILEYIKQNNTELIAN